MTKQDKVQEITKKLEDGVKSMFNSEKYKSYLNMLSMFHGYSFNNTVLIACQKPDASMVAGYETWKKFNRFVKKGEKAIRILAPIVRKTTRDVPMRDENGNQIIGPDGRKVTKKEEVKYTSYFIVNVFDISQTDGDPLPEVAKKIESTINGYEDFMTALMQVSPVPFEIGEIKSSANGYYDQIEKKIVVNEGMSEMMKCKTGIHEVSHAMLHDKDATDNHCAPDRMTKEVQAEAIAYTVCQYYGFDTSDYSFGYIAEWSSGKDFPELKASMEIVRNTAHEIIKAIDEKLGRGTKEENEATAA